MVHATEHKRAMATMESGNHGGGIRMSITTRPHHQFRYGLRLGENLPDGPAYLRLAP